MPRFRRCFSARMCSALSQPKSLACSSAVPPDARRKAASALPSASVLMASNAVGIIGPPP